MITRAIGSLPFVGRREEIAVLDEARRGLGNARGGLVLIGGEAGIGKTRLLEQFLRSPGSARGSTVAAIDCREEAQRPFGAVCDLLDVVASRDPIDVAPDIASALMQIRRAASVDGSARTSDGDAVEKMPLYGKLLRYFTALADNRATILAIDNLQWADRSTLDFLIYLCEKSATLALLVVATYRSDLVGDHPDLAAATARFVRLPTHAHVTLEGLSDDDIHALLQGALHGRTLSEETYRTIVERCEGNPFFAEELTKSALSRPGTIAAELPLSIRATIVQQLTAFTADERRLLEIAAVLGYRFDPALLAVVAERPIHDVLPTLRRATAMQLLAEDTRARLRFRHTLTLQAIRAELLAFDEREIHAAIVTVIEAIDDPERHSTDLAYHAWKADDAPRLLRYNERAGIVAAANRATPEAVEHFERALTVAREPHDRARLLTALGSALQRQGRLAEGVERFEGALELRIDAGEYDDAAELAAWIAGDRYNLGDASGIHRGRAFLERYGERLQPIPRAVLAAFLARAISNVEEDFDAVDRLLSGIVAADLPPRARQNYTIAQINRSMHHGSADAVRRFAREFMTYAASVPEAPRISALYTIAQAAAFVGALDAADRALLYADRLTRQANLPDMVVYGTAIRACVHWQRGELAEARACVERVVVARTPYVALGIVAVITPLLALAIDDDACFHDSFAGDVTDALAANEGDVELFCGARGTWLARRGRLDEARRDFARGLARAKRATPMLAALLLGCAEFATDDVAERAVALARDAAAEDQAAPLTRAVAALSAALAARRTAAPEAASLARSAAVLFADVGFPMREAQAWEAAGALDSALALYRQCGAGADVERLTALLAPRDDDATRRLTNREAEVGRLIAAGNSNADIAANLGLSVKTVEKHITKILGKLELRSRTQVAAYLARERRRT